MADRTHLGAVNYAHRIFYCIGEGLPVYIYRYRKNSYRLHEYWCSSIKFDHIQVAFTVKPKKK